MGGLNLVAMWRIYSNPDPHGAQSEVADDENEIVSVSFFFFKFDKFEFVLSIPLLVVRG
jgi:hypothetical protein